MTSFAFFSGVTAAYQSLVGNETGYIGRDATLDATILGLGDNIDVQIQGTSVTRSGSYAVALVGHEVAVTVGTAGRVEQIGATPDIGIGIEVDVENGTGAGLGRIFNAGEINSRSIGIFGHTQATDDTLFITNTGLIFGQNAGILLHGAGRQSITNSGTIIGGQSGVTTLTTSYNSPDTVLDLVNTGTIQGSDWAVFTGSMADSVVNRGRMLGDVAMGAGNDTLDARWGEIEGGVDLGAGNDLYNGAFAQVTGAILGGDGDDTVTGNAALDEIFDGGDGVDTVTFQFGAAAVVALDGSFDNDGAAAGDSYLNFERATGSATGADLIRGNAAANSVAGLGGADTLEGMGGNDWLFGGAGGDSLDGGANNDQLLGGIGTDTMTGGAGDDSFRFTSLSEIGDTITDWGAVAGNNDRFLISAAAFGGGLVAGGTLAANQFIIRADNVALDADDRFIFRTADRTLWFDADGTGAGAAVMVADLQAGTTVTAADIYLI